MSLINDALKRAATDKSRDAQSSAPVPPMQPVEAPPARGTSPLLLGGVLLLGIGAIGIAAALWFGGRAGTQPASTSANQTTAPANGIGITENPATAPASTSTSVPALTTLPTQTSEPVAPAISKAQNPPATTGPATKTPPPNVVKSAAPVPATSAPAIAVTKSPSATPTAAPKPVRLQSIFYRLRGPSVIINGKTLRVGDSFDGITVVSIQRTSVEITQNGKYRTLTLQD